jgi:peptide/nickel transport system permease protein
MTSYLIRRLCISFLILFLATVGVFLLMRLLPGDPLLVYVNDTELQTLTPENYAQLSHKFGLDKPIYMQYIDWLNNALHGDLGRSIVADAKITGLILERIPITLHISILSLLIGTTLGIAFGIICAVKRDSWIDTFFTLIANVGITIPHFWLGIILIYIFSLLLGWMPTGGYTSPAEDFWLNTRQIIMPVFVLSTASIAGLCRQTRSSMLEVTRQDYIRTAWSKGLQEKVIIYRHMIKNALIPVITILGMQVGHILGGSIIIETVFNIPGLGRLMVNSVFAQDYSVVQAGVLLTGTMVLLSNLVVEISYGWFDPRIRFN